MEEEGDEEYDFEFDRESLGGIWGRRVRDLISNFYIF